MREVEQERKRIRPREDGVLLAAANGAPPLPERELAASPADDGGLQIGPPVDPLDPCVALLQISWQRAPREVAVHCEEKLDAACLGDRGPPRRTADVRLDDEVAPRAAIAFQLDVAEPSEADAFEKSDRLIEHDVVSTLLPERARTRFGWPLPELSGHERDEGPAVAVEVAVAREQAVLATLDPLLDEEQVGEARHPVVQGKQLRGARDLVHLRLGLLLPRRRLHGRLEDAGVGQGRRCGLGVGPASQEDRLRDREPALVRVRVERDLVDQPLDDLVLGQGEVEHLCQACPVA
ncbi:hypothetical protein BH09PAT4_BH09PAT4_09630 [soil metagenome]